MLIVCPLLSRSTFYKNLLSRSTFPKELLLDHFQSHKIKGVQCNILDLIIYRGRDAPRTLLSTRTSWPTRTTASASSTAPSDASTTIRCRLWTPNYFLMGFPVRNITWARTVVEGRERVVRLSSKCQLWDKVGSDFSWRSNLLYLRPCNDPERCDGEKNPGHRSGENCKLTSASSSSSALSLLTLSLSPRGDKDKDKKNMLMYTGLN